MSKLQVETIAHTNNTTAMTIDSSGRVLQPTVPAFRVSLTADQNVTQANTFVDVVWDEGTTSESDNCFTQGGFSWSSGVVTVPVTGVYHFDSVLRVDGVNSGYIIMKIVKNNDQSNNKEIFSIEGAPASNYQAATGSGVFKLTASDNVRVTIYSESDTSVEVNVASIFSGHLIG
jgi:hypothetical protein